MASGISFPPERGGDLLKTKCAGLIYNYFWPDQRPIAVTHNKKLPVKHIYICVQTEVLQHAK